MRDQISGRLRAVGGVRGILWLIWVHSDWLVRRRVLLTLTLVVVTSVLAALGPIALKIVVDHLAGAETGISAPVFLLIGLYVLSQWLSRSAGEVRGFVYARAERKMFRSLSESLFVHVMRLPLRFHLERQTGAIAQTLDNGLQGYRLILHHAVLTLVPVIVELGAIIVVLFAFDRPEFLVIFCAAAISYAAAYTVFAVRIAGAAESASGAHVSATAEMTDSILNYETVKLFAAEPVVLSRVRQKLKQTEEKWVGFYRRYACNGLGAASIYATFLGISILYATHQVQSGRMTIGDFVLVNAYMLQIMRPMEMLGGAMQGGFARYCNAEEIARALSRVTRGRRFGT